MITINIVIIVGSLTDLLFSPNKHQLFIKRTFPEEMERGMTYTVPIELRNTSQHTFSYRMIDGIPQSFERPFPLKGILQKESIIEIFYDTHASVRGKYQIKKLYFRYTSLFGLWEKQVSFLLEDAVKVIPDLTETKRYLENAQRYLLYEGDRIRKHRTGIGDFSQIRNYVVGDDPRKINWRQTAKLQEVMTNEYEPEHGKYITILIDCGRMMGAELSKGNRLEKSLEAALTVSAAALQKGDYVSILAFSKEVKVFIPPAKGMAHLQTILQSIYHLKVDAAESNYAAILSFLETMQKKRSLLLFFSDVGTFLHEESALTYLMRLRRRHLFIMIGIEDVTLLKRTKEEPVTVQKAMVKSIAQQQMLLKKREKSKWEKHGLLMIEAREEKLATAAVSYYIDMMNRNLL
ncbi:DUF58 domain-containing protein [Bacillus sp. FJAT-49731]|uniref:DUF58 domain-containing protein n=2 Tax=Lederbergia citrea TaxID=2833581 RepID=A0A942UNE1_9BACI|nr:DUF58 domain-containing protein [Lederbergia citrea]MBS4203394.1 DUF58 domain-containing protein [Lederbergia citrea]MBS4221933.1 DUF58 domain-containing protein [Lederbergia citrea]